MDILVYYWLLTLIKHLLWVVELLTDALFGFTLTKGSKKEREEAKRDGRSAQLVQIAWKAHPVAMMAHGLENFLTIHDKYMDPKYILEKKNVTLFTMEKDCAVFCVTDPDVDVYDTQRFPFVFIPHWDEAKMLIILPLEDLNKLADSMGNPTVDVTLVHMTARCGSTLISQMMHRVPNTRSMSEPLAMLRLAERYNKGYYDWKTYTKLIQSCMRITCKVEPGSNIKRIVLKMNPSTAPQLEMLHEMFPKFKIIFNTRHPRPSILSLMKVLVGINQCWYAKTGLMWQWTVHYGCVPYKEKYLSYIRQIPKWIKPMSYEMWFVHFHAGSVATFLELKHIYDHIVLYENLNSNPDEEVEKLFKVMNVPLEYKEDAMLALKKDSQASHFGERGETMSLTDAEWKEVEAIFRNLHTGLTRDMTLDEYKTLIGLS